MIDESYIILQNSDLFDKEWYMRSYPDVMDSGRDPIEHYLTKGWIEGRNPSEFFVTKEYLDLYNDVKLSKINPLVHYIKVGQYEDRKPGFSVKQFHLLKSSHFFDTSWYMDEYCKDVNDSHLNPIVHYLLKGWKQNFNPSPLFDTKRYLDNYNDVKACGVCPLVHYLTVGVGEYERVPFPARNVDVSSDVLKYCSKDLQEYLCTLFDNGFINSNNFQNLVSNFEERCKNVFVKYLCGIAERYFSNRFINVKLAEIFFAQKNYVKSLEYFNNALVELGCRDFNVIVRIIHCYIEMNDFLNARLFIDQLLNWGEDLSEQQSFKIESAENLLMYHRSTIYEVFLKEVSNSIISVDTKGISDKCYKLQNYAFKFKLNIPLSTNIALYCKFKDSYVREFRYEVVALSPTMKDFEGWYTVSLNLFDLSSIGIFYKDSGQIIKCVDIDVHRSESSLVIRGQDSWLFLGNDSNDSVGQYEGKVLINKQNLEEWDRYIQKISKIQNLALCIPPSKESVYPQLYPYKRGKVTTIDQLLPKLDVYKVKYFYPTELLKKIPNSYYETDTHWSDLGAWACLKDILSVFDLDVSVANFSFKERKTAGDLGSKVMPNEIGYCASVDFSSVSKDAKCVFRNHSEDHQGTIIVYENPRAVFKKSICVFGDSFSIVWRPFLYSLFERVISVRSNGVIITDIMDKLNPDYIIAENTERFLVRPLQVVKRIEDYAPCIRKDYPDIYPYVKSYVTDILDKNKGIDLDDALIKEKSFLCDYMRKYYAILNEKV